MAATRDSGCDLDEFAPIAEVDTNGQPVGKFVTTSIRATGKSLGRYRWLLWVVLPVTRQGKNTA